MASGLISFVGGLCGGILGLKIPGQFNFSNMVKFQLGSSYFGVLPIKLLISLIKQKMEEKF